MKYCVPSLMNITKFIVCLKILYFIFSEFHWKRCLVRTGMVCVMVFVGESILEFGKILSLVGGSTITLLTFVLPSFFYMRLCDQEKQENWPDRYFYYHSQQNFVTCPPWNLTSFSQAMQEKGQPSFVAYIHFKPEESPKCIILPRIKLT